jgi:hypothetical protein
MQPYQKALLIAKGQIVNRSGIKKVSPMVTFADDRFLMVMLAKIEVVDQMLADLAVLLTFSDALDSESMMHDLTSALNRIYTRAGRALVNAAEDIIKGSAGAAGLIVGSFIKALWKPAALVALAYLIWKKLDRGTWSLGSGGSSDARLAAQATQARLEATRAQAALRAAATKTST